MGRVRRYKKFKAVDPFAKRKKNKIGDRDHNLPPDVKNHQAQRLNNLEDGKNKKKRKLPQWAYEELKATAKKVREEQDDRENLRTSNAEPEKPVIEGKREDESFREFHKRVRQGTTQLLKEAFLEQSSTNKKRKKYLDDKKHKKKLQKQGLWEDFKRREHVDEEGAAEEETAAERRAELAHANPRSGPDDWGSTRLGHGRADDEEGASFAGSERIRFGEVAHAPPDLARIPKPRGLKDQSRSKPWVRRGSRGGKGAAGGVAGGAGDPRVEEAQKRQMEEMRQRVQDAYASLKSKRRSGQTQFVGSDL